MANKGEFLPIYDLTPFTMLDFPDRIACIVWFSGCNMRCGYCHNPEIVKGKAGKFTPGDILAFLRDRRGLLEGVVLSGGEASLYEGIIPFARKLRQLHYAVKLDTNGTRPDVLRRLLGEGLLDYVALDYKAPQAKFKTITGISAWNSFDQSLGLLCSQSVVPFEVRTTVHTSLLDERDIKEITLDLKNRGFLGNYFVQDFRASPGGTLGNMMSQTRRIDQDQVRNCSAVHVQFRNF